MKKLLVGLAGAALLLGAGLGVYFGLFAGGDDGQPPAVAADLFGEPAKELSCEDTQAVVNAPPIAGMPAVVAVMEAKDIGFRTPLFNRSLSSGLVAAAKTGRASPSVDQELKDAEDGVLLYVAIVRQMSQSHPELLVSEQQARDYLENPPPGPCGGSSIVPAEWMTKEQLVQGIQIGHTTSNFVSYLINTGSAGDLNKTIADMIAQARPTVKITEVAFAAAGGLECTEGDAKVACPPDVSAPAPVTPIAKP